MDYMWVCQSRENNINKSFIWNIISNIWDYMVDGNKILKSNLKFLRNL